MTIGLDEFKTLLKNQEPSLQSYREMVDCIENMDVDILWESIKTKDMHFLFKSLLTKALHEKIIEERQYKMQNEVNNITARLK